MILNAIIGDTVYSLNVTDNLVEQAEDFFAKLDRDMDDGWQMSREWVDSPTRLERCQIVADKLLTALETENEKLGRLMAGYILSRLPRVATVEPDTRGEIQNTEFRFHEEEVAEEPAQDFEPAETSGGLDRLTALEQAGNEITKVFKVGKGYRFSVYDRTSESWQDAPLVADRQEAERLRQIALKARYERLQRGGSG
ncbi:hypothetical protein Thimo_1897 [Thioflavicoccus mobilis 8321]|uniref:Uncharacterized protein n=1 Tax=Thioflavicoccus mobilis 8321 TaxID=765912 RepID=L0GV85_9GAMM|nr:hypothetical protein [Thioflavicoccus mobilis]AGA90663.1 hypothetical protein Thimo_1897 [Thioflavicoccus mobilis 8321]